MAILFLPRQFHVTVVENSDVSHVSKAMWLFPLYLLLINIFVMPVAFGGILLGGSQLEADSFVLTIPLSKGNSLLALMVFIGGFSAATGMIIVESLALSTMVMNSLVMPAIFRFQSNQRVPDPHPEYQTIHHHRLCLSGLFFRRLYRKILYPGGNRAQIL